MKFKNLLFTISIGLLFTYCGTTKTLTVNYKHGLNNISPGADLTEFTSILGKPDEINDKWKDNDGTVYINYYKKGISLSVKRDTVQTIFYYFVSREFDAFKGTIESDITDKTNIEDIKQKFGEPDRVSASTVSKYGEFPGATEVYLTYNKVGVSFLFLEDKLANVRQFRPR
jgi:hypothetical protein